MSTECNAAQLEFQRLGSRRVVADFDAGHVSSDGGALLLRETDETLGVVERLAVIDDLLIPAVPVGIRRCQFQPIQGACRSQALALIRFTPPLLTENILAPGSRRQQRVLAKVLVVVKILIPRGNAIDALAQQ